MTRLCENGTATFVILDHDPLYDQGEVARIASDHAIAPHHRNALWRLLEKAGQAYLDQRRLSAQPGRLTRVRQDLQLARRLAVQLGELTPEPGQAGCDSASVALSRLHLSALREGERRAGADSAVPLDDLNEMLAGLVHIYDAALNACTPGVDPQAQWRSALTGFYTRTLARPWTGGGHEGGERFLADCRAVLLKAHAAAETDPRDPPGLEVVSL